MKYAVVALTSGGFQLATRIAQIVDCDLFVYRGRNKLPVKTTLPASKVTEFDSLPRLYPALLKKYRAIVLVMALGIVVRTIGPHLTGKDADPAVLVMDEKGKFVISLLSGHLGGANDLAVDLAKKIGAVPVITTSTDVQGIKAVDSLARELGWAVEPLAGVRRVNGALANGQAITIATNLDYLVGKTLGPYKIMSLDERDPGKEKTSPLVVISNRAGDSGLSNAPKPCLYLRPPNLYLGIGCKKGVGFNELHRAVQAVMEKNRFSWRSVKELASCTVKKDEAGLVQLAQHLGLPLRFYSPGQLAKTVNEYQLCGSTFVKNQIGVEAVCEPAAMTGAMRPRLVVPKQAAAGVTVAVAEDTSIL